MKTALDLSGREWMDGLSAALNEALRCDSGSVLIVARMIPRYLPVDIKITESSFIVVPKERI